MKKRKLLAIVLAGSLIAGSIVGCGGEKDSDTGGSGESEQVVNLAMSAEPDHLDSRKQVNEGKQVIVKHTQETLLYLDEEGVIQNGGAEEHSISEDGLVYTFKIRKNQYSDGTEVKAQDYANAILGILDPQTASNYAPWFTSIVGAQEYIDGTGDRESVGVTCPDDKTLQVTLKEKDASFLQLFAHAGTSPIPEEMTEGEKGTVYGSDEEGMKYSGPYYIKEWNRGSGITLEKNENYWDAENIEIDTINLQLAAEANTRQQLFEQGQIDILESASAEFLESKQKAIDAGEINYEQVLNPPTYWYVIFNNSDSEGIFTNAKIRKAFALAIDRETFVENVLQTGEPAYGMVPPTITLGEYNYRDNVEEPLLAEKDTDSKALLEEGLKEIGKEGETLEVTFLQRGSDSTSKAQAEFFQGQWQEKLGVKVKIDIAADSPTFNSTIQSGKYQIGLTGWNASYNDPSTFFEQFASDGNNPAFSSNEEYDIYYKQAGQELDDKKRMEAFAAAEKIALSEEAFVAPVYYSIKNNLISTKLEGVTFGIDLPINLRNASVK